MRGRKALVAVAAALVLLLAGGWYWGSPWWTLRQMKQAAEARDADKLAAYVDFPKLRESTKSQLRTRLMAEMEKPGAKEGMGALGAAFGIAMMGPMVDALITPDALRLAFVKAPQKREAALGKEPPLGADATDPDIVRVGLDEFRLRKKGAGGGEGDLVFRRHGLGWKLEEIRVGKGS